MNNLKELVKLINENPDLPVIPMVNNEVCCGNEGYWMATFGNCDINECTLIEMNGETRICFSEDIEEIKNYFYQQIENMNDVKPDEKQKLLDEKIQNIEWTKVIIVCMELPE